jgi:hypothetical protein
MNKQTILSSLLIGIVMVGMFGCVSNGKQAEERQKTAISAGAKSEIPKGWKTYVSKYGFSLSYPVDWYLKEDVDPRSGEEGNRPFDIYNHDVDNPESTYSTNEPWVLISVGVVDDISRDVDKLSIPSDPFEKILFLARKHNLYVGDKNSVIKKLKLAYDGCLIYYHGDKPNIAFFYLPNKDALLVIGLESESGAEELLPIVYSIKKNANKQ